MILVTCILLRMRGRPSRDAWILLAATSVLSLHSSGVGVSLLLTEQGAVLVFVYILALHGIDVIQ